MGRYDWEDKLERRQASQKKTSISFGWVLGVCLATLCAVSVLYGVFSISDRNNLSSINPPAVSITPTQRSQLGSADPLSDKISAVPTRKNLQETSAGFVQKFKAPNFEKCAKVRVTCVVDGDTIWLEGVKIRIADIDTPEVDQSKCAGEKALGQQATNRLIELLNLGPFEIHSSGPKDEDIYDRKLRLIVRDGVSIGKLLVLEGLARKWTGKRLPWCGN